jgi:diaminopimelate decarboxylase
LEIWAEPGRWISTPAMHILLTVIDKKTAATCITDGGTNLLGWERPLAEFVPLINLSKPDPTERRAMVYGSLCTPMDVWGESFFGEGLEEGDVLLVPDQGAYTYSLRQSFIKPRSRVIHYDGKHLRETEGQEEWADTAG